MWSGESKNLKVRSQKGHRSVGGKRLKRTQQRSQTHRETNGERSEWENHCRAGNRCTEIRQFRRESNARGELKNRNMHRVGIGALIFRNRASTLISVTFCCEHASLDFGSRSSQFTSWRSCMGKSVGSFGSTPPTT